MNELSIYHFGESIVKIIKNIIEKGESIDLNDLRRKFEDNNDLLDNIDNIDNIDNVAIFLRILKSHLVKFDIKQYLKDYNSCVQIELEYKNNLEKLKNLENQINDLLEEFQDDLGSFSLGFKPMRMSVKEKFLKKMYFCKEDELKEQIHKLENFYRNLLDNYGRLNTDMDQYNLRVKKGKMFEYFELSELLLNTIPIVRTKIKESKSYKKIIEMHEKKLYKISNQVITDLNKLFVVNNQNLEILIKDTNIFLDIKDKNGYPLEAKI